MQKNGQAKDVELKVMHGGSHTCKLCDTGYDLTSFKNTYLCDDCIEYIKRVSEVES